MNAISTAGRWLRRCWPVGMLLLFVLALVVWAALQLGAWHHWRQAQKCLAQGRARQARQHLAWCLKLWPNRVSVHLLAARAARQDGDGAEAERQLGEAERLVPDGSEELIREWTLNRAAQGDLTVAEAHLRPAIRSPEWGPAVCAALAEGYLRNYRGPEALAVLDVWLEQQPDNLHALLLRGDVWRKAEALAQAIPCYQRILDLDPEHDQARRWLALCLLDNGQPAAALSHWQYLQERYPDDNEVLISLARCRLGLGESEAARRLLEHVLTVHPHEAAALHTLGAIQLQAGQLAEAEMLLCRALRVAPRDYKINMLLAQVYRQQRRIAEAEKQEEKVRRLEARWKQFRQIVRNLAEHPHEPELLCQMGEVLLDLGYDDLGHRWLLSALQEDAACRRGHELLARWYEEHQDASRAAYHRKQANTLLSAGQG
jgi:predicted Zn-dependent protease